MEESDVKVLLGRPRCEVVPKDEAWNDLDGIGRQYPFDKWWGKEGIMIVAYENQRVAAVAFYDHPTEVRARTWWECLRDGFYDARLSH